MRKMEFQVNNKLEILSGDRAYKSDVQDVKDTMLLISIPVIEGHYVPFVVGEEIKCHYFSGDDVYKFKSTVLGRTKEGISLLAIEKPEPQNIIKIQRRNYVRVDVVKEIVCGKFSISLISKNKNEIRKNFRKFNDVMVDISGLAKCILLDISGGGMRICSSEMVHLHDLMVAVLSINTGEIIVTGKVMRIDKTEDKKYIYGLHFVDMSDKDRERIIRYIFSIMRDQRKKS